MSDCENGHDWNLWEIFGDNFHCKVGNCNAKLTRGEAGVLVNEHAVLKVENEALREKLGGENE